MYMNKNAKIVSRRKMITTTLEEDLYLEAKKHGLKFNQALARGVRGLLKFDIVQGDDPISSVEEDSEIIKSQKMEIIGLRAKISRMSELIEQKMN